MAYFGAAVQWEHVGGLNFRSRPGGSEAVTHFLKPYDIGQALYLYYLPSIPQLESCPHQGGHVFVDGVALSVHETLSLVKCLFDGANAATNFQSGSIAGNVHLLVHMFACPGHLVRLPPDFPPCVRWLTEYETADDSQLLRYVIQNHPSTFEDMALMDFDGEASVYVLGLIIRERQRHLDMLSLLDLEFAWTMTDVFGAHVRVVPVQVQAALQHCSTSASLRPVSSMVHFGFDFGSIIRVFDEQGIVGPETSALEEAARGMAQLDKVLNKRLHVDAQLADLPAGAPLFGDVVKMCLRREKAPRLRYIRQLASMGVRLERTELLNELLNEGALPTVFVLIYVSLRFGHPLQLPEFIKLEPAFARPLFPQLAGVIGDMIVQHGVFCPRTFLAELERISGQKWTRGEPPSLRTLALCKVRGCLKRSNLQFTAENYKLGSVAPIAGEVHLDQGVLDISPTMRAQINLTDVFTRARSILQFIGIAEFPEYGGEVKVYANTF